MPTDPKDHIDLESLFRRAEQAADRDAAQAGLRLQSRVMRQILGGAHASENLENLEYWTRAFIRGAWASGAVVAVLTAWVWFASVIPTLQSQYGLSFTLGW